MNYKGLGLKQTKDSWSEYLWFILFLGWATFVLISYFYLLMHHAVITLDLTRIWINDPILLAPVIILLLFDLTIWLLPNSLTGKTTIITIILITVAILAGAADHLLWLKAVLFLGSICLAGLGVKRLYSTVTSADIPYWAALILALILFHYWLFIIGLLGFFQVALILPFIFVLVGVGLFELCGNLKPYQTWVEGKQLSRVEAVFLVGIWLVFAAGFIGASAPETYSDAMRMHVPFMANVVREGTLKPNYYNYSHIMLSPLQLLGAGGYIFLGELGAKYSYWCRLFNRPAQLGADGRIFDYFHALLLAVAHHGLPGPPTDNL